MSARLFARCAMSLAMIALLGSSAAFAEIRPQFKRGHKLKLKTTVDVTTTGKIEAPDQSHLCEVDMEMEYDQSGDHASVTTFASVPGCEDAHGPYEIRLSYRDPSGTKQRSQHPEEWNSSNDGVATYRYALDPGAELTRVTLTGMQCFCRDGDRARVDRTAADQ